MDKKTIKNLHNISGNIKDKDKLFFSMYYKQKILPNTLKLFILK